MTQPPRTCASDLLEVVPLVFRAIRAEMRSNRGADLTVPQFRALIYINRQPDTTLNALADYLGLTAPTACRLVDDLVIRELVTRRPSARDRRRVALQITPPGRQLLESAHQATLRHLSSRLEVLEPEEKALISAAMALLERVFGA